MCLCSSIGSLVWLMAFVSKTIFELFVCCLIASRSRGERTKTSLTVMHSPCKANVINNLISIKMHFNHTQNCLHKAKFPIEMTSRYCIMNLLILASCNLFELFFHFKHFEKRKKLSAAYKSRFNFCTAAKRRLEKVKPRNRFKYVMQFLLTPRAREKNDQHLKTLNRLIKFFNVESIKRS